MFISYEEFRAGIHDNPAMLQALLIFDGVC